MFVEVILAAIGVVVAFLVGTAVGAHNASTITNAINTIKAAEAQAQATLAQITAHKAS